MDTMNTKKRSFDNHLSRERPDIDETYQNTIDDDANDLVYLLILSHGSVMFQNDQPVAVRVPENIIYINKITYTPLNHVNYIENDEFIKSKITEILNSPSRYQTPLLENNLIKSLEDDIQLLETHKKRLEILDKFSKRVKLTDRDFEGKINEKKVNLNKIVEADNKNALYTSGVFSKEFGLSEQDNPKITNKYFSIDDTDNQSMNIYVVFAKGGNIIKVNDAILKSVNYQKFLITKKNVSNENVFDFSKETTTELLLQYMDSCGFKNVVFIDYSCDVCININDETNVNNLQNYDSEKYKGNYLHGGKNRNYPKKTLKNRKSGNKTKVYSKSCKKTRKRIKRKPKKN